MSERAFDKIAEGLRDAAAMAQAARIADLEAEVADIKAKLRDPVAVLVNVLRGTINASAVIAGAREEAFSAAREAAAAALSRLTAQWPHVGPVPPTVRGEWALRDKALPAIRAIRPEENGA